MNKIKETNITQAQIKLRNMLENIAKELAPQYQRKLVVERCEDELGNEIYVAEERKSKGFLGIFSKREIRKIFIASEGFYGGLYGRKDMCVCLADDKAGQIVRKHLDQYAQKHGVTEIHMQ